MSDLFNKKIKHNINTNQLTLKSNSGSIKKKKLITIVPLDQKKYHAKLKHFVPTFVEYPQSTYLYNKNNIKSLLPKNYTVNNLIQSYFSIIFFF